VRPNVLLIMADQLKATALPSYGNPVVRTEALDALAHGGVRYDLPFTPHPLCVPARVSMWTGAYPHEHGVRTNELRAPEHLDNYLRVFQRAGYRTALFGKDHCFGRHDRFDEQVDFGHLGGSAPDDLEFAEWVRAGRYRRLWHSHRSSITVDQSPAGRIASEAGRFVAEDDSRPFLAWVSFPEPHEPYYAIAPFDSWYDPGEIVLPPVETDGLASKPLRQQLFRRLCGFEHMTQDELRAAVATYYAMVSLVDRCVGRLLEALRASGKERDTVVCFVADHGDIAGEHGMVGKCGAFYDCLTRIPLVLSWPGQLPTGQVVTELVSLIDVMPTLARLAGIEPLARSGQALPGLGLSTQVREAVYAEYGAGGGQLPADVAERDFDLDVGAHRPLLRPAEAEGRPKMVRTADWKYVYDPLDPTDELYDLKADPLELHNLARDTSLTPVVSDLRRRLLDWAIATEDREPVPLFFDPATLDDTAEPVLRG
jgi:arylsulfatase A-like enzyme